MKYKTTIEYDLNEDRSIKTWRISQSIDDKTKDSCPDDHITAAIALWGCKVLQNGSRPNLYEITEKKFFSTFNSRVLENIYGYLQHKYLPELEEMEWKNIQSHQEIRIED